MNSNYWMLVCERVVLGALQSGDGDSFFYFVLGMFDLGDGFDVLFSYLKKG